MTYAALGALLVRVVVADVRARELLIITAERLVVEAILHAAPAGL